MKFLSWSLWIGMSLVFLNPVASWAAVPSKLPSDLSSLSQDRELAEVLRLPLENRIQVLKARGKVDWVRLAGYVFDGSQPLDVRWRSLTALPRVDAKIGFEVVEKAARSEEWYLRNAAAVALASLPREEALPLAEKLVSDPALVVRTAAVQSLVRLQGREKEDLLWQKLNSPENFHRGQSLWIRRHIALALASFGTSGYESRWIRILGDKDSRLHSLAIQALEKSTGKTFAGSRKVHDQRKQWLAWWQDVSASATIR